MLFANAIFSEGPQMHKLEPFQPLLLLKPVQISPGQGVIRNLLQQLL